MFGLISDTHIWNGWNYGTFGADGVNSRLREISDILHHFADDCYRNKVKHILFGGDLFHTNKPTPIEIRIASQWFNKLLEYEMNVWLVEGNHDTSYVQSSLEFLNNRYISEKIHLLTSLKPIELSDILVLPIPFIKPSLINKEELYKTMHDLPSESVIFGHASTDTALPGIEQEFNEKEPITLETNKLLQIKAQIMLGHIHNRQSNIIGSPVQFNFGEVEEKFYWIGKCGHKGDFIQVDQTAFKTLKTNYSNLNRDLNYFIEQQTKTPTLLRINISDVPASKKIDKDEIKSSLPSYITLIKCNISREQDAILTMNKNFTLSESLTQYQKNNNIDLLQTKLEAKLLNCN